MKVSEKIKIIINKTKQNSTKNSIIKGESHLYFSTPQTQTKQSHRHTPQTVV